MCLTVTYKMYCKCYLQNVPGTGTGTGTGTYRPYRVPTEILGILYRYITRQTYNLVAYRFIPV